MTGGPGLAFHLQSPGKAAAWPARAAELLDWDGARECHRMAQRRPSEARLAPERWPGAEPFPPTTLARERDRSWLGGLVLRLMVDKLAMVGLRGPAQCREPPDRLGARIEAAPRPARNPLNRSPRPEWTSVPRSSLTGAVAQGGASSRGRRSLALSTLAAEAAAPVDDLPGQLPLEPVPDEGGWAGSRCGAEEHHPRLPETGDARRPRSCLRSGAGQAREACAAGAPAESSPTVS